MSAVSEWVAYTERLRAIDVHLDAYDAANELPDGRLAWQVADAHCPVCNEPVATLNGTCPWHPVPVVVEPYLESEAA